MPTIFAENPSQKHRTQELGTYFNIMQTRATEHFLLVSRRQTLQTIKPRTSVVCNFLLISLFLLAILIFDSIAHRSCVSMFKALGKFSEKVLGHKAFGAGKISLRAPHAQPRGKLY
jgi:hypothetical protein